MADADIQAFIYANQDVAMAADLSAGEGKQTFLEVTTHRMPKSQKILRELAKGFEKLGGLLFVWMFGWVLQ